MNKLQMAEQLRKALQFYCRCLSDEEAMIVATVYEAWKTDTKYEIDDIRSYGVNDVGDPQLYRCVQAHISQDDWTPDVAVSLWVAIGVADDGIAVWSQPTGAHDAYNIGDRVHFPDKTDPVYESLIDGNVYSPETYPQGWEMISE